LAFALSRLAERPTAPTPLGVFRDIERSAYGDGLEEQLRIAADQQGPGDLTRLLSSGDTWTVD
jgi:2-oxoglutarate ferredoxin oxidoreductase subunit beta